METINSHGKVDLQKNHNRFCKIDSDSKRIATKLPWTEIAQHVILLF